METPSKLGSVKNVFRKIYFGDKAKRNIILTLVLLGGIWYVYNNYLSTTTEIAYEYVPVTRKTIQKTVEGSGKVVSVSELDIQQLQSGGKVTAVYVKPGDYVKQGQIIAQLDNRQAAIQLAQAKASYDKVVNGSTKEDMDITKQSLTNAQQSYEITKQQQDTAVANAKRTLLNTSIAATPVYDSRIQPNTPTISGSYTCTDETEYSIKYSTSDYMSVTGGKNKSGLIRITSVPQPLDDCGLYVTFDMSKDYSNGEWKVSLPNKISSSYSANLSAYNNALLARDQALLSANTSITNAQLSLNQKAAGARPEDLASARASYASAQLSYENTKIRAPFAGQIGAVSAAVGQQTNSQQGVATIITKDKIAEISLNEIDIVNVKLGQDVELSFDAIPNETFKGSVSQINTVGVNTSNVVSFATKISIPNADERIKSGMSVTANIITDKKENVLSVPSATVKTENINGEEKSYVLKKLGGTVASSGDVRNSRNGTSTGSTTASGTRAFGKNRTTSSTGENQKVYVVAGISNDVDTEILEDQNNYLKEGELVVSKTSTNSGQKSTQTTFSLFGGGARPGGGGGGGNFNRTTGGTTGR